MAEASDAWLLVVDGAIRGNLGEARGGWHLNGSLVRTGSRYLDRGDEQRLRNMTDD
jgi:hypothetical protein